MCAVAGQNGVAPFRLRSDGKIGPWRCGQRELILFRPVQKSVWLPDWLSLGRVVSLSSARSLRGRENECGLLQVGGSIHLLQVSECPATALCRLSPNGLEKLA